MKLDETTTKIHDMDEGGIMDEIELNWQNEFYSYETQHKQKFRNLDISNKTSQTL